MCFLNLCSRIIVSSIFLIIFAQETPMLDENDTRGLSLRDTNMENINAVLINDGVLQGERLVKLNQIAIQQMQVLEGNEGRNLLK